MNVHVLERPRTWWEARRGGRSIVVGWLVSRVVMLTILITVERFIVGDVLYYRRKISTLFDVGLSGTFYEYPTPVTWLLWIPYGLTGGTRTGYLVAFVVAMLVLDAVFTYAVWRSAGRRHTGAVDFWLVFVFLIGPLCYVRFDILPAVLAGGAVLAARTRPWVTGALTGLGAAIKLWPALLIAAFLAHRPDRKAAGLAFLGVGFGLALLSLILGGWSRLVSPLAWQSERGLQIESVWASPVMVARAIDPTGWVVQTSPYQAYEVFGPGVSAALVASTVATVAGLAVIALLSVRAFRAPEPSPVAIGLLILATVAIMTVTNKTLSPQYVLWLGGPMAALMLLRGGAGPDAAVISRLAWQLVALALLTQLVYPVFYRGLLGERGDAMIAVSTVTTTVRNLALVAFTVEVCRHAWRTLGSRQIDSTR